MGGYGTSRLGGYGGYGSSYGSSYGGYGSGYGSSYGSSYGGLGGYGSSGYGSSYGGLSSYGSSYGGYGSRYGSGYGSSYGSGYGSGYGSSYGGYGSGYGSGYGGMGSRMGQYGGYNEGSGVFQTALEGGHRNISKFGQLVEGFARFSHLLNANFDALHGSFASVLRVLEVFGEFFYVLRTFAFFRYIYMLVNWFLGRKPQRKVNGSKTGPNGQLDLQEFAQMNQNTRPSLLTLIVIGITAPWLLYRLWRLFVTRKDAETGAFFEEFQDTPPLARALDDFPGEVEGDLPFRKNDVVEIIGKPFPEWWEGQVNGRRGIFPACLVKEVKSETEIEEAAEAHRG